MSATVSPSFAVHVAAKGGRVVVSVRGEVDMATGPVLAEQLDRIVGGARTGVTLDLAEVPFMDSSGLRTLLRAARHLAARGHDLAVRNPSPTVRRLLEVTATAERVGLERPPAAPAA